MQERIRAGPLRGQTIAWLVGSWEMDFADRQRADGHMGGESALMDLALGGRNQPHRSSPLLKAPQLGHTPPLLSAPAQRGFGVGDTPGRQVAPLFFGCYGRWHSRQAIHTHTGSVSWKNDRLKTKLSLPTAPACLCSLKMS